MSITQYYKGPTGAYTNTDPGTCNVVCVAGIHVNDSAASGSVCHGGCTWLSYSSIGSGVYTAGYVSTNQTCTSGADFPPAPDLPSSTPTDNKGDGTGPCPGGASACNPTNGQCPKGTSAEDVAGQAICVAIPKATGSAASGASAGASAPSTTGTTSGSTTTNSTTTTKTTTNPDGSTTTQTSTTSSSSGTETKPNDMGNFCKDNPQASACMDSGSWAGSCGHFTCSGDAVQCATARAANEAYCDSHISSTDPMVTGGSQLLSSASSTTGANQPNGGSVSVGSFDSTNPYTSQCPADLTVTVEGKSFVIPFSKSCTYLQFLGWCLVAGASLAGARIAFGRG